jgi:hypothetical protein
VLELVAATAPLAAGRGSSAGPGRDPPCDRPGSSAITCQEAGLARSCVTADATGMNQREVRTAVWLVLALAGCKLHAWGPGVPPPHDGVAARFGSETELRTYLTAAARERAPQHVDHTPLEGRPYFMIEPRVRPYVAYRGGASAVAAAPIVVDGDDVWVTLARAIARISVRGSELPAAAERFEIESPRRDELFGDNANVAPAGLLRLDRVVAIRANACHGIDVAHAPEDDHPLQICGRLISVPQLVRVGDEVVFYGAFDAIKEAAGDRDDDDRAPWEPDLEIPTVRTGGAAARSILELGPVYYPLAPVPDVIVRVVLRCDVALARCAARSFVSPRTHVDALWIDDARIALGFASPEGVSTVIQLPRGGEPRFTAVDDWVIGLGELSEGRLAVIRSSAAVRHPRSPTTPRIGTLGSDGRLAEGPALPTPASGRDGGWCWELRDDRFVYGPSRVHVLGGADLPRVIVSPVVGGAVDVQAIGSSVDAILFAGPEAVILGATSQGMDTLLRGELTARRWTAHAYAAQHPARRWVAQSERASLQVIGGRRILVIPFPDRTYWAQFELKILELRGSDVVDLGAVDVPRSPVAPMISGDDRLAVAVVGDRLVLRGPGELRVLELDASAARELGRIAL